MLINVPQKFSKNDIKYYGKIYKSGGFSFILSDIENKDIKNTLELKGHGYFNYVYTLYDTYLLLIGNQKYSTDIDPNKVDFLSKILSFEYFRNSKDKKIKPFNIPSGALTIISKERWLDDRLDVVNYKTIDNIINNTNSYLNAYQTPYERYLRYLCNNPETGIGLFKHGLSMNLLCNNKILVYKDTSIDGYIIKTDIESVFN